MIREAMQNADLWPWQAAALVLFFCFAVIIGIYLIRRGAAIRYQEMAGMPLRDDLVFNGEKSE